MTSKDEIISKIYNDPAGHGSMKQTLEDAKQKDKTINYNDVKNWFEKNIERKKQLKGFNSYIANESKFEYQIDLFFISKKDFPNEQYTGGVLCIDIFTKFITIIPIKRKETPDIFDAIKTILDKVGKPKNIYTDNEGAWSAGTIISKYFKDEKINHIITLSHPNVSERAIRTIKDEIYKRAGKLPSEKKWSELIYPILLKYNFKSVHSSIGLTPSNAEKPENQFYVKTNLEMHRISKRKYPDIHVGDYVKVYKKKDKLDKEHRSVWGERRYKVEDIRESFGQHIYYLEGYTQNSKRVPLLRNEILLAN